MKISMCYNIFIVVETFHISYNKIYFACIVHD